jgi:hypothetical protein
MMPNLLPRLLTIVVCLVSFVGVGSALAQTVGVVSQVQKQAQIGSRTAAVGTPVGMNDQLSTGMGARLQVTFKDDTTLTLGENARVVVDNFVYNPKTSTGAMVLQASRGALRFTTGKMGAMRNKDITVNTQLAALAVRGTDFWAGIIDLQYGVVLLSKTGTRVDVSNSAGAATLDTQHEGTDFEPLLKASAAPGRPYIWPPDKIARALAQTNFGLALGPNILLPAGLIAAPLILIPALEDEDRPASP